MKNNQININNNYQFNQFQNSLNLIVIDRRNFDKEMIDYGAIIINEAYNLMNDGMDRAKYISDSFNLKYPLIGKNWSCFILPLSIFGNYYYSSYSIIYRTENQKLLIFA